MPALNTRLKPWTRRFVEELRSGPKPLHEAVDAAAAHVPPGRAVRKFGRNAHERKNPVRQSIEEQIRSGAKTIVWESVRMLAYRERIHILSDGSTEYAVVCDDAYGTYFETQPVTPVSSINMTRTNRYATIHTRRKMSSQKKGGDIVEDATSR